MPTIIKTPPAELPVTTEEVKIHLRVDDQDEEDSLINGLIAAATEQAEIYTERRFVTQTWTLYLDDFPSWTKNCEFWPGAILLPFPPLQSVTSVKYYDAQGVLRTLVEGTDYVVDSKSSPSRIVPAPSLIWPSVQTEKINAVEIEFVCGYGAATAVPASIKAAINILTAHFYEHRQEFVVGTIITQVPKAAEWLLYPYRDIRFV